MGEAKRRGTFEERKATAVVKERKVREVQAHIAQRRASPKLSATMGLLAAMMASQYLHDVKSVGMADHMRDAHGREEK